MKKIAFHTLGCKLNFAETSAIASRIQNYERTNIKNPADIYVINTCTVTENAEKKLKELVRRLKRRNPRAKIVAVGCLAQRDPQGASRIPGIDLVLGMEEKFRLEEFLPALEKGMLPPIIARTPPDRADFFPAFSATDRTRAFLKIQEGCDYPCTYCIIPRARGKSRNPAIEQITEQARQIGQKGIKEIVLTGVNIGTFQDFSGNKPRKFLDLLRALDEIKEVERYRISSIEPNLLTPEIIRFVLLESKKFLPHFHMPLQSGSNEILAKMKRRYRRELYADRVKMIKDIDPDAAVGTDVITGFPGETEEKFRETYEFLKDLPVSYLHVFPYSDRPGTEASRMEGKIAAREIHARSRLLRELSQRKRLLFARSQEGKIRPVLVERSIKDGYLTGWTDNYLKVRLPYREDLPNSIVRVRLGPVQGEHSEAVAL